MRKKIIPDPAHPNHPTRPNPTQRPNPPDSTQPNPAISSSWPLIGLKTGSSPSLSLGSHLLLRGDVQSPLACLLNCKMLLPNIYVGLPVQGTVTIFNQTMLPTQFKWKVTFRFTSSQLLKNPNLVISFDSLPSAEASGDSGRTVLSYLSTCLRYLGPQCPNEDHRDLNHSLCKFLYVPQCSSLSPAFLSQPRDAGVENLNCITAFASWNKVLCLNVNHIV